MAVDSSVLAVAIDRARSIDLLTTLVRLPSHPGIPRQEEAVVRALAAYFAAHGLRTELQDVAPGRPNLLCTISAAQEGRHLLLCGHTDTVPLNRDEAGHGFSGEVRDGRVLGRGTADMKGAIAAMAATLVALAECDALDAGEVSLAAVIDEEMESLGTEALLRSSLRADAAIVGEPTGNQICLGHTGLEWLEIELLGVAAHGGTPDAGVNAILAAARFIASVHDELVPALARRAHPLLGPPRINVGTIAGGDQPSTVAARCTVTIDRRLLPGESFESVCRELSDLLESIERRMPGLQTAIRRVPGSMATLDHVALVTDADQAIVRAAADACAAVQGEPASFGVFPAWTDGALLSNVAGIPTIVLGPGDLSGAHAPYESIGVDEVVAAARIYAETAMRFCAGTGARFGD